MQGVSYAGVLAGRINNAKINNVEVISSKLVSNIVDNAELSSLPIYVGGLVGASTNASSMIENVKVNAEIKGNIKNAGGVIGLVGDNTSIKTSSFEGNVQAKIYVGGIAAQNKGSINTVTTNATFVTTVTQQVSNAYVGGLVGTNFGEIINAELNSLDINIKNETNSYIYMVGGVVGFNQTSGNINNVTINSGSISISEAKSYCYVAGLVASNQGKLSTSNNYMAEIGNNVKHVYIGGIVCYNEGNIAECLTVSNVYGECVGGIVICNDQNGNIVRCAVMSLNKSERVSLKGNYVGAIAFSMLNGEIEDCLAITKTYGLTNDSITAGFAVNFQGNEYNYGVFKHCILSNQFAGNGSKYLETPDDVLGRKRTTGTISNCVVEYQDNVITASRDKFLWVIKLSIGSNSKYTIAKSADMKNSETYFDLDFDISNIASSVWTCNDLSIPVLNCLAKQK